MSNAEKIRVAVEALNAGDVDTYAKALHPDAPRTTVGVGTASVEQSLADLRALQAAFEGFRLDADALIDGGDHVVARWRCTGRHTADYMGIPATGVSIDVSVCEIYRFDGDLVVETWLYGDPLEMIRQLGVPVKVG